MDLNQGELDARFFYGESDGELRGPEPVALPTACNYDHISAGTINRFSREIPVNDPALIDIALPVSTADDAALAELLAALETSVLPPGFEFGEHQRPGPADCSMTGRS